MTLASEAEVPPLTKYFWHWTLETCYTNTQNRTRQIQTYSQKPYLYYMI